MSFNNIPTPSPGQLRELLPEVATAMESFVIMKAMRELGIEYRPIRNKRGISIQVPLSQNHVMLISPVDRGPGGIYEHTTVVKRPKLRHKGAPINKNIDFEIVETLREHVQIFHVVDDVVTEIFSYTLHEDNMKRIIQASLESLFHNKNLTLTPIERRTRIGKKKPTKEITTEEGND